MAIIDMGTGSVAKGEAAPVRGNIINLETGQLTPTPEQQAPEEATQQPAPQQQVEISPEVAELAGAFQQPGQLEGIDERFKSNIAIGLPKNEALRVAIESQRSDQAPQVEGLSPFPEQRKETQAAQTLPEFGSGGLLAGESTAKTVALAPLLLATTKPEEVASILTANFPDVGISQDPGGNLLATNNRTGVQVILNKPGMSQLDVLQGLGIATAFMSPASLASLPAKVGGKALVGGTAAAVTQSGIEAAQQAAGGEFNKGEVALAGGLGVGAELVAPAIQSFRQGRQASQLDVAKSEVAETLRRIAPAKEAQQAIGQATGVTPRLFQAQQTMQPSTLIKQRLIPQLDAGAQQAAKQLEAQNSEVFEATTRLINSIAPADVVSTGAKRFRGAAKLALEAGRQRRSEAVRPLFKDALKAGADVDLTPVKSLISEALDGAPATGKASKKIKEISLLLQGKGGAKPTLLQLQKAKFEIDDMLELFGDNALGVTTKRDVVGIKKALVDQMEAASPLYKAANEEFARLSPAVKELQDSIIGSIAAVDDVTLKEVSKKIFDATESNPEVIRQAKKIIDGVDPGAWDDLLRVELQRKIGGLETLADDIPGELAGNLPGQLRRAIFGNPTQRKTLLSGMSKEQRKNFVYLDEVLRRASTGRHAGSPTTPFAEALDRLKGSAGVIRDMILRPLESLKRTGERGLFDRNVAKMTDVLFNPKWEPRLIELRGLNPESKRAGEILQQLIDAAKAAPQISETPQVEQR